MKPASRNKVATFVSVFLALAVLSSPAFAAKPEPTGVAPLDSHPYGKSYEKWTEAWWSWVMETPVQNNAVFGNGGCAGGQSGDVWFLYGIFKTDGVLVQRSCDVPVGKAFFFPLINNNYFSWQQDDRETKKKAYLLSFPSVTCDKSSVEGQAFVDGVLVANVVDYWLDPHFFNGLSNVQNDIFEGTPGLTPDTKWKTAVDVGSYLFLYPLPPGSHTIEWQASFICQSVDPTVPPSRGYQNINYQINVLP